VLAYEAGIKVGLFDQHAQLNAAAFYYDYKDKQLRGAVLDPTFGPLEAWSRFPDRTSKASRLSSSLICSKD
jgi:iron complex outermembrane recepter protein